MELTPELIGGAGVGLATIIATVIAALKGKAFRNLSDGEPASEVRVYETDRLRRELGELRRDNDQLRRDLENMRQGLAACERRNVALMERLLRNGDS